MPRDARFWRNVTIIGLAHVALLVGLIRLTGETKKPSASDIVWMSGDAGEPGVAQSSVSSPAPNELEQTPPPAPEITPETEERASTAPIESDIQLPSPTPTPVLTPTPSQKPTQPPTPKLSPKPSAKKTVVAKASPKPTARAEKDDSEQADEVEAKKKKIAKVPLAKKQPSDNSEKSGKNGKAGHDLGKSGAGAPGVGASEFGWYGNMLHDRFYSEWAQPMSLVASGAKLSTLVKLRIQKDGRVSDFTIIRPSGNVVVDESVAAVAKRVTQVDPLPAGLGGEYYEVKINFELNPEQ